ncbi:MAG: serine protease [Phycisphaerae bacterium]|jgi:serine protease Do
MRVLNWIARNWVGIGIAVAIAVVGFVVLAAFIGIARAKDPVTIAAPVAFDRDAVTVKVLLADGHGSGVLIGDGTLVLTAGHVTKAATDGKVRIELHDGTTVDGLVIWAGVQDDIAIIKIAGTHPAASLDCGVQQAGLAVEVVGFPHVGGTLPWAHTYGRVVQVYLGGLEKWPHPLLILDAALYFGSSGGPVFDLDGKLIGIVNAMTGADVGWGTVAPFGFNIATPASYICELLP